MDGPAYTLPAVKDYGTLVDLTAGFHAEYMGAVNQLVSLAVVSAGLPLAGGSDGAVAPSSTSSPDALNPSGLLGSPGTGGTGGVLGTTGSGGSGGGAGSLSADHATGAGAPVGSGGKLPFTGYFPLLSAAVGASMVSAGLMRR